MKKKIWMMLLCGALVCFPLGGCGINRADACLLYTSSADWERERFTMDEGCSEAVKEVFIRLFDKGYIYKGSRIINWCPVCKTSISDAEVEHVEQTGHFWHIKYPIIGEEGRFVEIATTRPETMLGDTAVAVNPDDERYTDIIGKKLLLPIVNREIPVIADPYVEMCIRDRDGDYLTAGVWVIIILAIAFCIIVAMNLVAGKNMKNTQSW